MLMTGRSLWVCTLSVSVILLAGAAQRSFAENRSINGSGNNVIAPFQGAADTGMIRFGYSAEFGDAQGAMIPETQRVNARDISNVIFSQTHSVPSARGLSDYIWAWGQFVGHDMDLVNSSDGAAVNGTAPIAVNDVADPLGPNPIPFTRANWTTIIGGGGGARSGNIPLRTPVNQVSSYIDASQVYGSHDAHANALRTAGGKLLTDSNNLLPMNTMGLDMENNSPLPDTQMFAAGDIRANENPLLTSLQTVFAREHNRLVDIIATQQPTSTDEERYQLARKIVGAEMQIITYREFLPALLGNGPSTPKAEGYNYNSNTTAAVTNAFAHAAYRFGHSAVSSTLNMVNDQGADLGDLPLRNAFFNPTLLRNTPELVDDLLRGAARQTSQEIDHLVVDDLRNFLFGPPGAGGLDLAAVNIQRGRDVGLPNYVALRKAHQIGTGTQFSQITSDADLAALLSATYDGNINKLDPWVGGLAEDHVAGASVGPLMKAVIESQFQRLRDGDRLFFLNTAAGLYNGSRELLPEIAAIIDLDNLTLADILQANTDIAGLQANVFFAVPEPSGGLLAACGLVVGTMLRRRTNR